VARIKPIWGLILLAGCSPSEGELAEKRLAIVQQSGSMDDQCRASREVEAAWLKALNTEKYKFAKLVADVACRRADQIRQTGI